MGISYERILQSMLHCSEAVRDAVVSAEHRTMSEVVGMGADGADTSLIDQVAENAAIHCFETTEPTANILSEEVGFIDRGSALTLIVDPIDSTSNATVSAVLQEGVPELPEIGDMRRRVSHASNLLGFPYFAFSVAARVDDQIVAACIRNLPTGDVFTAILGDGSHYNGLPIQTTKVTELNEAWVALIRPSKDEGLRRTRDILFGAKRVRITGCSALDIALVGSGGLHALVNPNAHRPPKSGEKVVDYAAGCLILREAGGMITDTEGAPLPVDNDVARLTPIVAAATPELHHALIRSIHPEG